MTLVRFDSEDCLVVAAQDRTALTKPGILVGERFPLTGDSISARIRRTGAPDRIDDYATASGPIAARLQGLGVHSGAGTPMIVDGVVRERLAWWERVNRRLFPAQFQDHIGDFADPR